MILTKLRGSLCLSLMAASLLLSNAATATVDEAAVKRAMQLKYPDVQVESGVKTPMTGIYEVFVAGEIFYVDADVSFMIVKGNMIDVAGKTDLTEERLRVLTAIKFDQLPLDLAFRIVKGNGKRKMAYFTDPNCPYCKRLDQALATMNDVTVHVFLYPVLGPDSLEKSKAVWCSKDRAKVYTDMMLNGNPPKAAVGECNAPIDKIVAFGRQKGIRATPTMFFADGQRVSGAIPADQRLRVLNGRVRGAGSTPGVDLLYTEPPALASRTRTGLYLRNLKKRHGQCVLSAFSREDLHGVPKRNCRRCHVPCDPIFPGVQQ